jgi:hypothetical protein
MLATFADSGWQLADRSILLHGGYKCGRLWLGLDLLDQLGQLVREGRGRSQLGLQHFGQFGSASWLVGRASSRSRVRSSHGRR